MGHPNGFSSEQIWTAVAAFFGASLSLAYLRDVKPLDAFVAIASGVLAAIFLGGAAMQYLGISGGAWNRALGFIIGLSAMSIFGGVFVWLERWRANPSSIIRAFVWWRR